MKIEEVFIRGFRNLKDVPYLSTSQLNVFIGDNAQGKTNFLESLYVALRGESFRYYSVKKDWIPSDATPFGISIRVRTNLDIQHQVEAIQTGAQLRFFMDEKRVSTATLKTKHPIVIFSPDDHQLIRGEPGERRLFFEDVLSDGVPGYAEHLTNYEKALKNRNTLLKNARETFSADLRSQLEHWNILLAREGVSLLELREESWPEFQKIFHRVIHEIFHTSRVDMEWKVFHKIPTQSEYVDNLRKNLEKDVYTGWTHFGVHREDFEMSMGEVAARTSASQGQARILAMALRWSHAEWIRARSLEEPIFFVDDFSSELDERHRRALLERLFSTEGQVFLTGTKESFLEANLESKVFANIPKAYIVNGKILNEISEDDAKHKARDGSA